MKFNQRPLTTIARTITEIIGADAPKHSNNNVVDEIKKLVEEKTQSNKVDKILIYNPDAIGEWIYNKYRDRFKAVEDNSDISVSYITAYPPMTPVCFATMFTGAQPQVHGIKRYTKPRLDIDTIFDSYIRAGLKVAMVAVAEQSIPKLFAGREMDYYLLPNDKAVIDKALELIKENKYDVIEVYNQEYDDAIHRSHPQSRRALKAIDNYVSSYTKLVDATREHWKDSDTFLAFATDHGTHRAIWGLGMHYRNIPKDMNIIHFYSVQPKVK